jgi:hypothetical protein
MSDASSNEHGKASFELDLGRIGFVVIIPVMLWVFYTTFSGLVDIMRKGPDDNFGLIGAVIGAAAILSLMALRLLGSELGAVVAGRRRAAKGGIAGLFIIIPAFLFFFGMSAFFSYTIITLTYSIFQPGSSPGRRNRWNWPWPCCPVCARRWGRPMKIRSKKY